MAKKKDCADCPDEEQTDDTVITAASTDDATGLPDTWHAVLTVEGLRTTDHRRIAQGALSWRELPMPIFAQFTNAGHGGAALVGQITEVSREAWAGVTETTLIMAKGTFDLGSENGREAARMCAEGILRWGSIDLEILESQYVEIGGGGGDEDFLDLLFGGPGSGATDWYDEVTLGRIAGYTMVAIPAFPQAVIAPANVELDIPEPMLEAPTVESGLMASGVAIPTKPPAGHFDDPDLEGATPLTVTSDGRVYGHLALWNTCHTGFSDSCIVPPRSDQDYAYFLTGQIETDEGEHVKVGHITFDTGHAGATMGWQDTTRHYDHTGHVAADINVGEDEFGIWFSGALRPGLTDEQVRVVKASPLSGDWRKIGGGLELVAALAVNVPGFPIVASGKRQDEQISLISAGMKPRNPLEVVVRELATLRKAVEPLMPLARRELMSKVGPSKPPVSLNDLRERVNAGS